MKLTYEELVIALQNYACVQLGIVGLPEIEIVAHCDIKKDSIIESGDIKHVKIILK